MDAAELAERLSRIMTHLSALLQAHKDQGETAVAARQQLVLRYYGAAYRYLLGMLRDPAAAEELTQDFAVRFLRGDFKHFDPARGRFRDYLKAALRHLVADHERQKKERQAREHQALGPDQAEPIVEDSPDVEFERVFVEKWKEELLARTWEALEKNQEESNHPYYTVLRCATEQPDLPSKELAIEVGAQLRKPVTEENVRQLVHRARKRFAELLVTEIARSLETAEPKKIMEELAELELMGYCRSAVDKGEGLS